MNTKDKTISGNVSTESALDLALEVMQINLKLLEKINPYKGQEDLLSDSLNLTHEAIAAIKQAFSRLRRWQTQPLTAWQRTPENWGWTMSQCRS